MNDKFPTQTASSSSPCFAHELEQNSDGSFSVVDEQQKVDVARLRKTERQRLIAARLAVREAERAMVTAQVSEALDDVVSPHPGQTISLYWPFRGELDLRGWMRTAFNSGARVALPVVKAKYQPLIFREWTPDCRMERGVWNILQPSNETQISPNVVLSPLVGHDPDCFRLGYGGGFFDRTLAAADPKPLIVGVGLPLSAIPTIFPQPHDIPMDVVLTGREPVFREG